MEVYLNQRDLYLPLSRKANKLASMMDEEWEILDRKALGILWLCLETSVAFNISKEKTMVDMMKELAKLYEKPSASNKVFLMKNLFNMNMLEGGNTTCNICVTRGVQGGHNDL